MNKEINIRFIECEPKYNTLQLKTVAIILDSIKLFENTAPKKYYKIINKIHSIPWIVMISNKMSACYGYADCNFYRNDIINVELKFSWELNRKRRILTETVTHELAHGLDFLMRKTSFHDEPWREIHKILGGTGRTLIY